MIPPDNVAVSRQLGREPRPFEVAERCPFGAPSVIQNMPSRKLPTTFWLTCPALDAVIAGVEAAGGVKAVQEAIGNEVIEEIHEEHRRRYSVRVAGVREGGYVKCLHAFTALHISGAMPNPVAEWTLSRIGNPYPPHDCCTVEKSADDPS